MSEIECSDADCDFLNSYVEFGELSDVEVPSDDEVAVSSDDEVAPSDVEVASLPPAEVAHAVELDSKGDAKKCIRTTAVRD